MSIIYGLGKAFFEVGIYSYVGVISKPSESGKNFGTLFAIWGLRGFLINAIEISNYPT